MAITGSSLYRVMNCPSSESVPHTTQDMSESGEMARYGSILHRYIEDVRNGNESAINNVPEAYRDSCELIDIERLPQEMLSEVAFAYNLLTRTCRVLGKSIERDYEISKDEIALTVDLVGVDGDSVVVIDLKFGWGELPDAGKNPQLLAGALFAAIAYEKHSAQVGIARKLDNGYMFISDWAEIDEIALLKFEGDMRKGVSKARSIKKQGNVPSKLDFHEGPWCKYCPGRERCPAKHSLIQASMSNDLIKTGGSEIEVSEIVALWHRKEMAKQVIADFEKRVLSIAKDSPIDLGNGYWLGEFEDKGREQVDGTEAYQAISRILGPEHAVVGADIKATKASIRRAVRSSGKKGKDIKKYEEMILSEIREMGGLTREPKIRIGKHKKC